MRRAIIRERGGLYCDHCLVAQVKSYKERVVRKKRRQARYYSTNPDEPDPSHWPTLRAVEVKGQMKRTPYLGGLICQGNVPPEQVLWVKPA